MKKLLTLLASVALTSGAFAQSAVPENVTDLTTKIVDGCDVSLTWTLPVEFTDGVKFPEGTDVSEVKIFRDAKEIATLPGAVTEFVDKMDAEENPLSFGFSQYRVQVCVDGEWSALCYPVGITVGEPVEIYGLPWTADLTNLKPDFSASCWRFRGTDCDCEWTGTAEGAALSVAPAVTGESWLATYPLKFEGEKRYVMDFTLKQTGNISYSINIADKSDLSNPVQVLVESADLYHDLSTYRADFYYLPERDGQPWLVQSPCIVVMARANESEYPKTLQLTGMKIYEHGQAGIISPTTATTQLSCRLNGNCLTVDNPSGELFRLAGIDGRRITESRGTSAEITLQKGMYVLSQGGYGKKIIVR